MRDGSRPRFTASLPRRFYGGVINFHVEKPVEKAPAAGMFCGSQRWWIRIHRCDLWLEWDVLRGQSVLDPAAREPGPFLKRSFVLIAAIGRPSARRFLYVPRNRWQIPCLYRFNALSAHAPLALVITEHLTKCASNFLFGKNLLWKKCILI